MVILYREVGKMDWRECIKEQIVKNVKRDKNLNYLFTIVPININETLAVTTISNINESILWGTLTASFDPRLMPGIEPMSIIIVV